MSGGDLPEAKMNEAQCTTMVVVRADEGPAVNAMECRAKRGTNALLSKLAARPELGVEPKRHN